MLIGKMLKLRQQLNKLSKPIFVYLAALQDVPVNPINITTTLATAATTTTSVVPPPTPFPYAYSLSSYPSESGPELGSVIWWGGSGMEEAEESVLGIIIRGLGLWV
ncbi:hypothetical protein SMAC4_13887 [Sordaria macrospora]|uniref:WGS project CABT00000000 data, contig 2.118 n=1 Tax=Sordaria macrospora (strain ATCC MYA-333 / DSM 997 / K(L3346) / K-hell) TaxID=771870 RepID=F7WCD3_SORMK|nr:uncharacterized protein SMAC_09702 [Sordaria macrospora k-hell]WPJ65195.1 hypothetical protein SMAC4_13887 [Sordaria macrospora]CCC14580.1 unnamed protein product [Sordaria macrospora k-hell]